MATEEHEIAIEVICTSLPGTQWGDRGPVHLGIQQGAELVEIPVLVDEINSLWNKPAEPECAEGCSGQ
jgi:hypothetical protein